MKLVYGTTNAGKIAYMRESLRALQRECGLDIIGLDELGRSLPDIEESGAHPLDNAREKALAYHGHLRRPVFSLDSGLYFDGVREEDQPGVHIRRVHGRRLTDDEMVAHYAGLAARYGGRLTARYVNGICLVMDEGHVFAYAGEDIASERFYIVTEPRPQRLEGFPLDRLSVEIDTGAYYLDTRERRNAGKEMMFANAAYCRFFRGALAAMGG